MAKVTMYSTQWCPFCLRAEQLLQRKGVVDLVKIEIDRAPLSDDCPHGEAFGTANLHW